MLDFVNKSLTLQGEVKFRVVSLFSGCGGSSLGYIWAGGKVLAAVEWDENAVATYRLNFPDTPVLHRDIKTVTVEELLALTHLVPGELDILDGSPPCQGFSTAGKRQIDDPRNSLFQEYVRLLRGLKPKCFVMENVSGMVKGNMKHVFAIAMRELKASGYRVKCQLMNAMYFGVPQSRERVIFIGVRNDLNVEPTYPLVQSKPIGVGKALNGCPLSPSRHISHRASMLWKHIPIGKTGTAVSGPSKDFSLAKLNPLKPSPTFRKGQTAGNGIMHWNEPRYVTMAEMARIGSFPDAFQWLSPIDAVARIGNSVPPMFMYHLASHIHIHILQRIGEVAHV